MPARRSSSLFALWVAVPLAAAAADPEKLAKCPGEEVCLALERQRERCEAAGAAKACTRLVADVDRLLDLCDCSEEFERGCRAEKLMACVNYDGRFADAVRTLAALGTEDALRFLASRRLRDALTGGLADELLPVSFAAERRLLGLSKASSTLAASRVARYDAELSADQSEETAWCEGVPGDGVGAWVEHRWVRDPDDQAIIGFFVVPGYAKDRETFLRNGRVVRIGIEPCGRPERRDGFELPVVVPPASEWLDTEALERAVYLHPDLQRREFHCFRFTVLAVERGSERDTCIGEIEPILGVRP